MKNIDKIKIVISGASGKPYKFEAKIKEKSKAINLFRQVKKSLTRKSRNAVYFSFTILEFTDIVIKYNIVSYGYVDDIDYFIRKFKNIGSDAQRIYIAYYLTDAQLCSSIIYDLISASNFDGVKEHISKICYDND